MNSQKSTSLRRSSFQAIAPDYPLQGTRLDIPLEDALSFSPKQRKQYVRSLLTALAKEIKADTLALKRRVPFAREMRDLRKLLHSPPDQYLYTDEKTLKRNVLGRGSPGSTHTYWSRTQMWKMATKGGDLRQMIMRKSKSLTASLERLFDPENDTKATIRNDRQTAVENALQYMQFDKGGGTAFPPFHAKFFADKFLPKEGDGMVFDPCAGWGGRLLGTLAVNRKGRVTYFATDPEKRNKLAYDGLIRRINIWLKKELSGERAAHIFYQPFEDWIQGASAKKLLGNVDLALTSPPYFSAENYNPTNAKQSANRYKKYEIWRDKFYRRMMKGVYDLLKPGGVFVLNIADVAEAPRLERDARALAHEIGFTNDGFYKLAMSINPKLRVQKRARHVVRVAGSMFKYEPVFVLVKPASAAHTNPASPSSHSPRSMLHKRNSSRP